MSLLQALTVLAQNGEVTCDDSSNDCLHQSGWRCHPHSRAPAVVASIKCASLKQLDGPRPEFACT